MIDQRIGQHGSSAEPLRDAAHAPDPLAPEKHQPDPILQTSTGRMGYGGISIIALAIVVFLAIVFYGLNGRNGGDATHTAQSSPPETVSHPSAPHG